MKSSASRSLTALSMGCAAALSLAGSACSSDSGGKKGGPAPSGDVNWVTMGYDLRSTYNNTQETRISKDNVATLKKAWQATILNYGTPVIVGDTLYTGGTDGIYAFDANTGNQIWKFSDGDAAVGASSSLSYENGTLYFTQTSGGDVVALDVTKNPPVIKWNTRIEMHSAPQSGAGFSSAIVLGDYIVAGNSIFDSKPDTTYGPYRGSVAALHKADGSIAWQTHTCDTTEDGCAVWGSVSADMDAKLVYAPVGNNYSIAGGGSDTIQAFDLTSGTLKWKKQVTTGDVFNLTDYGPMDYDFGANPVVVDFNGKKLVAGGTKGGDIYIWDRIAGGDPITSRHLCNGEALHGGIFQGLAFDGEHLILTCNHGKSTGPGSEPNNGDDSDTSALFALVPDTLDIAYERQLGAFVWTPITIANGVGFLGMNTRLEAFDIKTGALLFTYQVPGTIASGITISNGRLFFGSGLNWLTGKKDGTLQSLSLP